MAEAILAETGIYAIRNKVNGKRYVGSAINIKRRWVAHKSQLVLNCHHSKKLQNAWNKYSQESFVFEVIEEVHDKAILILVEQKWINEYNSFHAGYNSREKAESFLGMKQSRKFLETMSKIMKGNKYGCGHKRSTEQLKRMSEVSTGKRHTAETIEKIRVNSKKLKHKEESKRRISDSLIGNTRTLGFKQSNETKEKVSSSLIGNKRALGMVHSAEAREKMSRNRKGGAFSIEVRARMSAAQKGKIFSEETRKKMSDAAKARHIKKKECRL